MKFEKADSLAKLVAARLNHDYVSPLTAISNGLEIYQLDDAHTEDAIAIIQDSLTNALAELQFNRIAFGTFGNDEQLAMSDVQRRIEALFARGPFELFIDESIGSPYKYDAKLWFLAILCLRSSFMNIYKLEITPVELGWKISATGQNMVNRKGEFFAENNWLQLDAPTPTTVHFPLLHIHSQNLNYDLIRKRQNDEKILLQFWKSN